MLKHFAYGDHFVIFQTMYNAAAFKARTKARAKFRDKRSVMMNGE